MVKLRQKNTEQTASERLTQSKNKKRKGRKYHEKLPHNRQIRADRRCTGAYARTRRRTMPQNVWIDCKKG
jgi:hypothetical protein